MQLHSFFIVVVDHNKKKNGVIFTAVRIFICSFRRGGSSHSIVSAGR
jgi:hypothetical protein